MVCAEVSLKVVIVYCFILHTAVMLHMTLIKKNFKIFVIKHCLSKKCYEDMYWHCLIYLEEALRIGSRHVIFQCVLRGFEATLSKS